ncbi:MAG: RdgB/HAM1 family non-canonical purine NTP pyrophosphatase [Gammaproteobacteria bacterium]|nr:RdgB/HAM1 family non-canonical purine NTP pyrophosphatase [Gammaproteobacteria bacterium]
MTTRILLASGNPGKLREINTLLKGTAIDVASQAEFEVPDVEETGLSFVENALIKARNGAEHTGLSTIADDSGLEVDALAGAPGIYSARYAGSGASDADNLNKLLLELEGTEESARTARFQCVMVYLRGPTDPTPLICQGTWEGRILTQAQGQNGFGYDPVFYVPSHQCSAAQLPDDEKNRLSHRGIALRALVSQLT